MTKTIPTAKELENPLLAVLLELSLGQHGIPIPCTDTYEKICQRMGITRDQFGAQKNSNALQTDKQIQWAFKNLVRRNLADRNGKGVWTLTVQGVAAGKALLDSDEPQENEYHSDPYIRLLAVQNTKCHKLYSPQEGSICQECPLQKSCIKARLSFFSSLKEELEIEDQKNKKENGIPLEEKKLPTKGKGNKVNPISQSPWGPAEKITLQKEIKCTACEEKLKKGEEVMWVRGDSGKQGAVLHIQCYNTMSPKVNNVP